VAQAIERLMPDVRERKPELLAHHFTSGGRVTEAIAYWHRAGQRAFQRSANIEAAAHLTKGLELVVELSDAADQAQHELRLRMLLGAALGMTRGWAAPEVGAAMARAREMCEALADRVGDSVELFFVRWGLWRFYASCADFRTAEELATQLLRMGEQPGTADVDIRIGAHLAAGVNNLYRGSFGPARDHFEQGLRCYDPAQSRAQALRYGQDLGVAASSFLGWTLAITGDLDRAAATADRALWQARATQHPPTIGLALFFAGQVHQLRRDAPVVRAHGDELLALAREQSFPLFSAFGMNLTGWARVASHDAAEGVAIMQQGADLYRSVGQRVGLAHRAHLAEAHVAVGRLDDAAVIIAAARRQADESGEHAFDGELHRVDGEILLRRQDAGAAAAFERAIEIASAQGAWLFALRAALALARLEPRGRDTLRTIVDRFPQGLDQSDIANARTLLEGQP
jgi:tetratricopeptide (TPR) repeat protein